MDSLCTGFRLLCGSWKPNPKRKAFPYKQPLK
ncbi:hypothetical protein OIU74_021037 [Salix koriyanagi]|uniref:Uncharacterized protein n=1 Tax=Salix koriyanagi TaxID=2511006 RepID=A0A9Q0P786_9ROSI|nr:hypothetical protein OIU74_021037 [Salix koriyanagi]